VKVVAAATACAALIAVIPTAAGAASPVVSPKPGQRITLHRVTVVVRAGGEFGDLRASLNGRSVSRDFSAVRHGRRTLVASASHGLRRGRNVLRVRARVGTVVRSRTVRFTVTRRGPLVGAGRDRVVRVGSSLNLAATVKRSAAHPGSRAVRWRVVRRPRGSRERRVAAPRSTLRPAMATDVVGTYKVQVIVGHGRNATTDTVTVDAIPADPLVKVDTRLPLATDPHGGQIRPGVQVGDAVLRAPYLRVLATGQGQYTGGGPSQPVATWQVVAIDRTTTQLIWNRTYGLCQSPSGDQWCRSLDHASPGQGYEPVYTDPAADIAAHPGALVLATSTDGPQFGDPLTGSFASKFLSQAGFPADWHWIRAGTPLSGGTAAMIGVVGEKPGDADYDDSAGARLRGYLTHDQLGSFHFAPSARVPFDTRSSATCTPSGCTLKQAVGSTPSTGTLPVGDGGYLVTAWDRWTLARTSSRTFPMGVNDTADAAQTTAMLADLTQLRAAGSLVTISSYRPEGTAGSSPLVGTPRVTWNQVVNAIADLGGTKNGFVTAISTPAREYSLIGWGGLGEGNGYEAGGATARLRGALTQNQSSQFEPHNVSSRIAPAEHFISMLYTPTGTYRPAGTKTDTWPYSDTSTGPGAAIACIGAYLGKTTNPRAEYATIVDEAAADNLVQRLDDLTAADLQQREGCTPSAADLRTALTQLKSEITNVGAVRAYMTMLAYPSGSSATNAWSQAVTLGNSLRQALDNLSAKQQLVSDTLGFLGSIAGMFAPGLSVGKLEKLGSLLDEVYATLDLAEQSIERSASGARQPDQVVTQAQTLAATLQQRQISAAQAYGPLGDIVIGDYNKLTELGTYQGCVKDAPGGCPAGLDEYSYTPTSVNQATNASMRAMMRTIYAQLVTYAYPVWNTGLTRAPTDPYDNFQSPGDLGVSPFRDAPAASWSASLEDVNASNPVKRSRIFLMVARSGLFWGYPSAKILKRMFGSTGPYDGTTTSWMKAGLGMDPLETMRSATNHFVPSSTSYYTLPDSDTEEPGFLAPLN
jgi:hypothetical protein